jgi:hypothetical protein
MDLIPLCVKRILHRSSYYFDMRTHRRQHHLIGVPLARRLGIRLRNPEPANNLKNQIPALIVQVPGVQQVLKSRIDFKPSVSIAIALVAKGQRGKGAKGTGTCEEIDISCDSEATGVVR